MPNNIIPLHHGIAMRAAWYVCLKIGRFSWKSRPPLQLSLCGNGLGKKWKAPNWNLIGQTRARPLRLLGGQRIPDCAFGSLEQARSASTHPWAQCGSKGQPHLRGGTLAWNCGGVGTGSTYVSHGCKQVSIPGALRSTAGNCVTAHLNQPSSKKNRKWFSRFGQVL